MILSLQKREQNIFFRCPRYGLSFLEIKKGKGGIRMGKKKQVIKVAARQEVIRKRYKAFLDDLETYLHRVKKRMEKKLQEAKEVEDISLAG